MLAKRIYFIIVLSISFCFSNGQNRGYIWCFGDSTGLDFNSGTPVAFSTVVNSDENSAAIADESGNLLFYCTDRNYNTFLSKVVNRNHQIMLNGDSITSYGSCANGFVILPFPNDTNKYYIFYIAFSTHSLCYSMVDMSLDSGRGAITLKNIILPSDSLTERLMAIRHADGRDWWLIMHSFGSNQFVKYLITPFGINGPFIQSIGSFYTYLSIGGEISVTNKGDKVAMASREGYIDIYDFDRCSGTLNNWINVGPSPPVFPRDYYYGCAFSPEGTALYVTPILTPPGSYICQFDLTASNIIGSRQTIYIAPNDSSEFGQLQLGPDGKIYVASAFYGFGFPNSFYNSFNMNISVINSPDLPGMACNFVPYSIPLGGKRCFLGLPNMPNYNLGALVGSPCDTLTVGIEEHKLNYTKGKLYPNPNFGTMQYEYSMPLNSKGLFVINDITDREIVSYQLNSQENKLYINQNFAAGVYQCHVFVNDNLKENIKLIIVK